MKENKQLVSAAELDALIQDWGSVPNQSVDKFFPIRFWFVFLIALGYAVWLLFAPEVVAKTLSIEPIEIARLSIFLYFRGWFLVMVLCLAFYVYLKNRYLGIAFSVILLLGSVNFVFDLFNIYAEKLAQPTSRLTLFMLLRITALWFVYLCIKNVSRIPQVKDRFNILLPFKSDV